MKVTRVFVVLYALLVNCDDTPPYYKCLDDSECLGFGPNPTPGRCLMSPVGPFCAFPDSRCPTMWRWDNLAHESIVNNCVDPSVPLDAAPDAPADMSPSQ